MIDALWLTLLGFGWFAGLIATAALLDTLRAYAHSRKGPRS